MPACSSHAGRFYFAVLFLMACMLVLIYTARRPEFVKRLGSERRASTRAPTPEFVTDREALASEIADLDLSRAWMPPMPPWNVPVYVLSMGGERLRRFAAEMATENQTYQLVNTSVLTKLRTDFHEPESAIACTRAHLAFAERMVRDGHRCALVAEDDASFKMSIYWPVTPREMCDRMDTEDPEWTTLMLYSSDTRAPDSYPFEVQRHSHSLWGTVSYMATRRWALSMMRLTGNATRLMRDEIGTTHGVADVVAYECKGCSAWVARPSFVFPNNLDYGTQVGQTSERAWRDGQHIGIALRTVRTSLQYFQSY